MVKYHYQIKYIFRATTAYYIYYLYYIGWIWILYHTIWQKFTIYTIYYYLYLTKIYYIYYIILHLYNKKRILSVLWQRLLRSVLSYFHSRFSPISSPCGGLKRYCDTTKMHKALGTVKKRWRKSFKIYFCLWLWFKYQLFFIELT